MKIQFQLQEVLFLSLEQGTPETLACNPLKQGPQTENGNRDRRHWTQTEKLQTVIVD